MPTKTQLGVLSKLYVNTATFGTPTWSEVPLVGDCALSAEWDWAEALTRFSRMKLGAKTMLGADVKAKLRTDLTDANYTTILNALFTDGIVDIMVLNGSSSTNGVRGVRFESQVISGNEDQGTGVVVFDEVTFKPALTGNAPQSVLVTSGAPVFTAI